MRTLLLWQSIPNLSAFHAVGVPHITGTVSDELWTWIAQAPNAPINRAFDVRLHCLTTVLHACRGFAEIAPSAWSDYQAEKQPRLKQNP